MIGSFTTQILEKEGGVIRLLTSREQGEVCWFYIRLSTEQYQEYKKALKRDTMNIADYGTVLRSGWGNYPEKSDVMYMKQLYNFETPKNT